MWRTAYVLGALLTVPAVASAGDLGTALEFIDESLGEEAIAGYEAVRAPPRHDALAFLNSRDITPGADLDSYDCGEAAVDGAYTLRTNGNERWSGRACVELRFRQERLSGYRVMGPRPLTEDELEPLLRRAEAETDVPAELLDAVIRFRSGRRPGLVSDDGRQGLMQLSPALLRGEGLRPTNLLDPWQNVRLGARYIRQLTLRFGNVKMALAAYIDGPTAVAQAGDIPNDPETIWFVREVMRLYYASIREFPTEIAAESMTFVWNWLE